MVWVSGVSLSVNISFLHNLPTSHSGVKLLPLGKECDRQLCTEDVN